MKKFMMSLVCLLVGSSCVWAQEGSAAAERRFRRLVVSPEAGRAATEAAGSRPERGSIADGRFPSYDATFPPPAGETDPFALSQDYPSVYNTEERFAWEKIDFRVNWASYLREVLKYCLEGNVEVDFRVEKNSIRRWYHAPWMHNDSASGNKRKGREFHHGMTRERSTLPQELHPSQTSKHQNWAVSLYNDRGGYTLGKVWLTPDGFPDPSKASFPDQTVSFKLLFTAASVDQVPFLKGAKEWTANVNPEMPTDPPTRVDRTLRLLQVDLAVKDPRVASGTGWVFGTFVYDGFQPGQSVWERMVPVGVSWGDDQGRRDLLEKEGSFLNPALVQSALNPALVEPESGRDWGQRAYLRHFGLGGRLNGPVDNPASSCISCHGRAGTFAMSLPLNALSGYPIPILAGSEVDNSIGRRDLMIAQFPAFFRLVRGGSHLETMKDQEGVDRVFVTLDYSLQLSQGLRNFYEDLRSRSNVARGLARTGLISEEAARAFNERPRLPEVARGADD